MRDDPILLLERELLRAAERRTAGSPVAPPATAPQANRRPRRRGRWSALAVAGAAIVPVIAVLVAVLAIRGHSGERGRRVAPASLSSELGVLRSAGSPRERAVPGVRNFVARVIGRIGHGDTLRRVRVVIAPIHDDGRRLETFAAVDIVVIGTPRGDRIVVSDVAALPPTTPLYFGPRPLTSAAQFGRHGIEAILNQNTRTGSLVVFVVPDGVARVRIAPPGQRSLVGTVRDNVVAFVVRGVSFISSGGSAEVTWYAAGGAVLRRLGDVAPRTLSGLQVLQGFMPVLRRPARSGDRPAGLVAALSSPATTAFDGRADTADLRLAATTPWSARVYVVPFAPQTHPILDPGALNSLLYDQRNSVTGLGFFVGPRFGCCVNPGDIRTGVLVASRGGGPAGLGGSEFRAVAIAPGIAAYVRFELRGGIRFTVRVHGDVAAVESSDPRATPAGARIVLLGARGQVLPGP